MGSHCTDSDGGLSKSVAILITGSNQEFKLCKGTDKILGKLSIKE